MLRRRVLRSVQHVARCLVIGLLLFAATPSAEAAPPNILLIIGDDK